MANKRVRILLYSGGNITHGVEGCEYTLPPQEIMFVDRNISLRELLITIYSKIKIDPSVHTIRLICRYPWNELATKYARVPINNDEALRDALQIPRTFRVSGVDIFVECDVRCPGPLPSESFGGEYGCEGMEMYSPGRSNDWNIDEMQIQSMIPNNPRPRLQFEVGDSSYDMNLMFQPSMGGCSRHMEQAGGAEMHEAISLEESEEIEAECLYVSDDSESGDLDYGAQLGDPDDEIAFYHDIGDEKSHKIDAFEDFDTDQPIWVDENSGLKKGMLFATKELFQYAVKRVCAKEMKAFKVSVTNPTTWKVQCINLQETACSWMVSGKKIRHGCFEITKVNSKHSCMSTVNRDDHPNFDSKSIARVIRNNVVNNPAYKPCDVRADMSNIGVGVTYKRAWLGKHRAKEDVYGNWETSYSILPRYFLAIQAVNQGTVVRWKFAEESVAEAKVFDAVFWAFFPSIEAFQHCRPLITIDGTHQYGRYKETIFIACGVDGNGHTVPLAFAITGGENLDNWQWFLENLMEYVVRGRQGVCIISDRHSGILSSFRTIPTLQPPFVHHRFCLRHFLENFSKRFKNVPMTELVNRAARTPQVRKFDTMMASILHMDPAAHHWLMKNPLSKWTLCYDGGVRYGVMTTNRSESFNGVLKGSRDLPITAFVRATLLRLNGYFVQYSAKGVERVKLGDPWTDDATKRFLASQNKARDHSCIRYDDENGVFDIVTKSSNSQTVCLSKRCCTCGKFQIYKIPCSHAYRACSVPLRNAPNIKAVDLVDELYGASKMVDTYACKFVPVPHPQYWPSEPFKLLPNSSRRNCDAGRLCNTRLPNEQDHIRMRRGRCTSCHSRTHTAKTCPRRAALRRPTTQ